MMEFEEGSLDEYYYWVIKNCRAYDALCKVQDEHPAYQALEQAQQEFREKDKDNWEERHKALKVAKAFWDCEEKKLPEHGKWVKYMLKVANHKLDFDDLNKLQMAEDWFENR